MTLNELKGKYARLSNEIDTLALDGVRDEARMMRLMNDLDRVYHELRDLRLRTLHAPTLRDAVIRPEPVAPRLLAVVPSAPPVAARQTLSMAG